MVNGTEEEFDDDEGDEIDVATLQERIQLHLERASSKRIKGRSSQSRRVGCLLAIAALDAVGGLPIKRKHLRSYLYLVDVLLPVFDNRSFEGVAYKRNDLPHQLDWLWDADRLLGMGLLIAQQASSLDDVELYISQTGRNVVSSLVKDRRNLNLILTDIKEIAISFSRVDDNAKWAIGAMDANCSNPYIDEKETFDYSDGKRRNFAVNVIQEFEKNLSLGIRSRKRVSTYVYLKALEGLLSKREVS